MTRILVVEDTPEVAQLVRHCLLLDGFDIDVAFDGHSAMEFVRDTPPDLMILDLVLPDIDGMEICRRVRAMEEALGQPQMPILILTALGSIPERVSGLEAGGDDYVPKPFAITELMARVRSLLRRSRAPKLMPREPGILSFGDLTLDCKARTVFRGDREIFLTAKQFKLLATFMKHPQQVLTHDMLMQRVWGDRGRSGGGMNVLAVTLSTMRKALEECGEPRLIQTVPTVGYVLRSPHAQLDEAA